MSLLKNQIHRPDLILKVANILKLADEQRYAHVRYNVSNHTWEVWVDNKPALVNFSDNNKAEDKCEYLNYEYMASKVLERLGC